MEDTNEFEFRQNRTGNRQGSEEVDDFLSIESVTPQSNIDTIFQSKTEKVSNPCL